MKKLLVLVIGFLFGFFQSISQEATWKLRYEYVAANPQEFDVYMDITIPKGFHMYSFDQAPGGPIAAVVSFTTPAGVSKVGGLRAETKPREYFDDIFGITVRDFEGKITWKQRFRVSSSVAAAFQIQGTYSYQLCLDDGMCITPFPVDFSLAIAAPKLASNQGVQEQVVENTNSVLIQDTNNAIALDIASDSVELVSENVDDFSMQHESKAGDMSLLWIFVAGFIGGLLAFLTPCVFPMVPMTVSMFIKRDKTHARRDATIYGASIIAIFVSLGILITLLFGVDALNKMATSPLFNVLFFAIFLLFAISFFGAFELMLPSSWINYMDKKSDSSSGLLSIFFMAFTLVLVSFSCTAMIIGTLLVQSVVTGSLLGPFMGMLGFSVALALPFVLFALFPSMLQSLPKSGGWLNSVKVVLGFIELGLALKFLSNADLVAGWGILPRDLFIAIWIVLLILLGLYILGYLRFYHDSEVKSVSVPRFMIALFVFSFALYLFPGMFGAPLKSLSGYLPPATTQSFDLHTASLHAAPYVSNTESRPVVAKKYADEFQCPHNLDCFFDYEEGLAYAKQVNKPILLDFTGKACANCRKIEMNVWSQPDILGLLSQEYVIISLYVDSRKPIEPELVRTESYGGKTYKITTVGEHWSMFMMQNYGGLMQPYYVLLSPDGNRLAKPITYTEAQNPTTYKEFLLQGIAAMKK